VIYAAADLEAATARIQDELEIMAVGGGRHEGHGTYNRIVPLGGGYLEVLAIADPQEAADSNFGRGLLTRLTRDGEGWLAWVVAVPDIDPVARRLGSTITTLAREGLSDALDRRRAVDARAVPTVLRQPRSRSRRSRGRRRCRRHHLDRTLW
jgi:hypothetical protein